jgi:hypothetical protein
MVFSCHRKYVAEYIKAVYDIEVKEAGLVPLMEMEPKQPIQQTLF